MPSEETIAFFYEHAGWSYQPDKETAEEGRRRGAIKLAEAEAWAKLEGVTFTWSEDWDVGNHGDFYGPGSAYEDHEPETCEHVAAELDGEVIASLGCVDDASAEYRRVVEAELAVEAQHFVKYEKPRREVEKAANLLVEALAVMNRWGDEIDRRIATQAPGLPYGETYKGLVSLLNILWPGDTAAILDYVYESGLTLQEAAAAVAKDKREGNAH